MRRTVALGLFLVLSGSAWANDFTAGSVTVTHPWARATPAGAKVGAAYMELSVKPGTSDRLVAVKTDVAGRVELHNTAQEGGVMTMRRAEGIAVADKGPVVLQPGGSHVMLMDLKQPLKQGDTLKLTLVFEKAGELPIEATVEPVGAKGPQGMDHQPAASPGAAHKP